MRHYLLSICFLLTAFPLSATSLFEGTIVNYLQENKSPDVSIAFELDNNEIFPLSTDTLPLNLRDALYRVRRQDLQLIGDLVNGEILIDRFRFVFSKTESQHTVTGRLEIDDTLKGGFKVVNKKGFYTFSPSSRSDYNILIRNLNDIVRLTGNLEEQTEETDEDCYIDEDDGVYYNQDGEPCDPEDTEYYARHGRKIDIHTIELPSTRETTIGKISRETEDYVIYEYYVTDDKGQKTQVILDSSQEAIYLKDNKVSVTGPIYPINGKKVIFANKVQVIPTPKESSSSK